MAPISSPPCCERHRPEDSVLYRILETHLDAFLVRAAQQDGGAGLPGFVTRELRAYLRYGRLEHGCIHVRCEQCGDEMVVAFSCKGRGFCPSCGARRMSELAAHLVDGVIPKAPVRQWVLSLPFRLRFPRLPLIDARRTMCPARKWAGHRRRDAVKGKLALLVARRDP
jgi:hypothetical protein